MLTSLTSSADDLREELGLSDEDLREIEKSSSKMFSIFSSVVAVSCAMCTAFLMDIKLNVLIEI